MRSDGASVDWSYCGGNPYVTESCNTQACAPTTGNWSSPTYNWPCQTWTSGTVKSGTCTPGTTNSGFQRGGSFCPYNQPYAQFTQTCQ
jgi:hypothetical protein